MLHQTAFLLPKTLALLTTATLDTDFLRWHHVTGSRVTVSTGSVKCPIASVRTIFQRFLVAYRSVMLRTVLTNRELETWLQWRRYSLYTPVNRTISWHPHPHLFIDITKYNQRGTTGLAVPDNIDIHCLHWYTLWNYANSVLSNRQRIEWTSVAPVHVQVRTDEASIGPAREWFVCSGTNDACTVHQFQVTVLSLCALPTNFLLFNASLLDLVLTSQTCWNMQHVHIHRRLYARKQKDSQVSLLHIAKTEP